MPDFETKSQIGTYGVHLRGFPSLASLVGQYKRIRAVDPVQENIQLSLLAETVPLAT